MHYKAIFHINELKKWKTVLSNVGNLLKDLGKEQVDIIVLANGESVRYYAGELVEDEAMLTSFVELAEQGVRFVACNNALNGHQISRESLHSYVEVVPAGVTELIKRQHEGFAYIKP